MSSFNRRYLIAAIGAAGLAGCGFKPLYGEGQGGGAVGRFALAEATNPVEYAYRERLRRRIGHSDGADLLVLSRVDLQERGVAVTRARDITRFRVEGSATAQIVERGSGKVVATELVKGSTGFDATSSVFATRQARKAAEERLAIDLAERAATRILARAAELGGGS